jgi:hypothetical protein
MQESQKIFYCEYEDKEKNSRRWLLTTDENFAKETDQSYALATLDDLLDFAASTGIVFKQSITVFEGNVKWQEKKLINRFGDIEYVGDYEFVD